MRRTARSSQTFIRPRCWLASAAAAWTSCFAASSSTQGVIETVKRKTLSALIYPTILISLALILVGIIVLRVVPAFTDFYVSFGAELPLITRIIVWISSAMREQFLLLLFTIGAAVAAFVFWIRQPGQRARFDHLILRLPIIGDVAGRFATSQMARTLATLLGGGLPLVDALEIAAKSVGNQFMAREIDVVTGARARRAVVCGGARNAPRLSRCCREDG